MNDDTIKRFIVISALWLLCNPMFAQNFQVSGDWSYTVLSADITEAGNDFPGTYTSLADEVQIDVKWGNRDFQYRIEVRRDDIDWNSQLQLWVQRTGDGKGRTGGTISGGTPYQQITNSDLYFFGGSRTRQKIPVQYQVRNVSVVIPAKTHSTTVVFTFIEE